MAESLLERGLARLGVGDLDAALNAFTEAASTAGSVLATSPSAEATHSLKVIQGRAFGNLSNIFFGRQDYSSAIMFSEKALRVFEDVGERERAAISLFNLAVYELKAGNADTARRHMANVLLKTEDPQRVAQANRWLLANDTKAGGNSFVTVTPIHASPTHPALTRPPAPPLPDLPPANPTLDEARLLAHARLGHPDELRALLDRLGPAAVDCRALFTPLIEACRAARCTVLHILTVQLLLHRRAAVDATDYLGATALMHAALSCSVCTPADFSVDQRIGPASGWPPPGSEAQAGGSEAPSSGAPLQPTPAVNATAALPMGRPRAASDGSPRHLQLVMMLLNGGASPYARSHAGISPLLLLAASPLAEAVAVFQELVNRAAAVGGADAGLPPWWGPDCRGRNILHYCARAGNAEGARIVLLRLPRPLAAQLVAAPDCEGVSPAHAVRGEGGGDPGLGAAGGGAGGRRLKSPKPRRRHSVTSPSAASRKRTGLQMAAAPHAAPQQQQQPPQASTGTAEQGASASSSGGGEVSQPQAAAPPPQSAAASAAGGARTPRHGPSAPGLPPPTAVLRQTSDQGGAAPSSPSSSRRGDGRGGAAGGGGANVSPRQSHRFGMAGGRGAPAGGGADPSSSTPQQDLPPEVRQRQCQFLFAAILAS